MFPVLRIRLRSSRRGGLVAVASLVAVVGGVALGSLAAARRTDSSYDRLLAATHPSDMLVLPDLTQDIAVGEHNLDEIAHLPQVTHVATSTDPQLLPLAHGDDPSAVGSNISNNGIFPVATLDGEFSTHDAPRIVSGRMLTENSLDEFVASPAAALAMHMKVGQTIRIGLYDLAKTRLPGYGTAAVKPDLVINARLVGIAIYFAEVVQDDADRVPTYVVFSSRLGRMFNTGPFVTGLKLAHGAADAPAVEAEIRRLVPGAAVVNLADVRASSATRAIEPDSLALAGFGLIAGVAALLIGAQVITRLLRSNQRDLETLRALGADRPTLMADSVVAIVIAIVVGAIGAAAIAMALSPLSPIGPVRPVETSPGVAADWTVLLAGAAALVGALGAFTLFAAWRSLPPRRRRSGAGAGTLLNRVQSARRLPLPAWTGLRLAWRPRSTGGSVAVAPAVLGATLAIGVLMVTQIFGASLHTLVTHPDLYGWNWDTELQASYGGVSNIGKVVADRALHADKDVKAWSGAYFFPAMIDALVVPAIGMPVGAAVGPPMLSGRPVETDDEIALGESTLAQLHKRVGDTVKVSIGRARPKVMRIVGTVTLPAVGAASTVHTEMAVGALVSDSLTPPGTGLGRGDGPEAIFLRYKPGTNVTAANARLARLTPQIQSTSPATDPSADGPPSVVATQRPAEIVNYRSMGTTPALMALLLTIAATSALALTLIASVRSLRRDFAILQSLGFTRRQIGASVAWQSTFTVALGALIGIPLGIIAGTWLWTAFAHHINVPAQPTVSIALVLLVVAGALLLANVIAVGPRLIAAKTQPALLLQAE
jgi:hypothetical protein